MLHRRTPQARSTVRFWLLGSALLTSAAAGSTEHAPGPFHPALGALADIRSVDLTAERHVLHAVFAARLAKDDKPATYYAFSRTDGKDWTRPVRISKADDGPVLSKRGNDVQLAMHGRTMVAIWQQQGELPGTGPLVLARSEDGGRHWSRGGGPVHGDVMNNQSYPDLAVDQRGNFHLLWLDDREESGNTQGLRHAVSPDHGQHWRSETTIDLDVCTCCWNRAVVLPDRSLAVLYRGSHPHDMRLAARELTRGTWQVRSAVGPFDWQFEGCPHCGGGLAVQPTPPGADLHSVIWTGKQGSAGLYYLGSTNSGTTWSPPVAVSDAQSREADIAATSHTVVIVFASLTADGATSVMARRSSDRGGHWSEPVALSQPGASVDHPRVTPLARGFLAYWTELREGGGKTLAFSFLE